MMALLSLFANLAVWFHAVSLVHDMAKGSSKVGEMMVERKKRRWLKRRTSEHFI